jgi:hypothetical protein
MKRVAMLVRFAAMLMLVSTTAGAAAPGAAGGPHGAVQRDVKSGQSRLVAQGSAVTFQVYRLCRYNPESNGWSHEPFAPINKVVGNGIVAELTGKVGLYWVKWKENGRPFASLVFSSPVLCNDISLGPPPSSGVIATCIPFVNSARAAYIPDPQVYCER